MPFDPSQRPAEDLVSRPSGFPRPLLAAGVACACALGVALGLWARPSDLDRGLVPRRETARAAAADPQIAPRTIEIRVDHHDAAASPGSEPPSQPARPVAAQPLAAAPPAAAPPAVAAEAPPPRADSPELMAPKRPPAGLMRVHAVAPLRLEERPAAALRPAPAPARPEPTTARRREAEARVKVDPARRAAERRERARLAAATDASAAAARKAQVRAHEAAERKAEAKAQALAEAKAQALAEAKAKALKRRAAEQARAQAAKLAQAKAARARDAEAHAAKARALHLRKAPIRGSGPLRTAHARCTSPDPGAAMTCADPSLSAADRELSRAYREAQAAGVPASMLERQQQRWLAARATAARQAPWAVHDVYLARIAELQDQTRRASQGD
jgi:hypothetical protein